MNPSSNDQSMHDQSLKQEKRDTEIEQLAKLIINKNNTVLQKTAVTTDYTALAKEIPATEPLSEDNTSVCGQFGWTAIATVYFPYLMRSGEKYISIRMLEMKMFPKYPSKEIARCIDVESFKLTNVEATLLNEINTQHCDNLFGTTNFSEEDYIISLKDAMEIHEFLEFCYSKLRERNAAKDTRCGFVRIIPGLFLPYVRWDSKRYVPLFYLSGELEYLEHMSKELKGWELTYLKFLCKVHNTIKSMSDQKSIRVVDFDIVKQCFYPGVLLDDMWPPNNQIEILLGHSPSESHAENTRKRKEIAENNMPEAKKLATQSQITVNQACQNVLSISISDHPLSANPYAKVETIPHKLSPQHGLYKVDNRNLVRLTQSGGGLISQAAISDNAQTVFTNITNHHTQTNKDHPFYPPSYMYDQQPVRNITNWHEQISKNHAPHLPPYMCDRQPDWHEQINKNYPFHLSPYMYHPQPVRNITSCHEQVNREQMFNLPSCMYVPQSTRWY